MVAFVWQESPLHQAQILQLASVAFMEEAHNLIFVGGTGTGKTHLSQAIGILACQKNKKVKFITTNALLSEFYRARADETHDKVFKRYAKFDVLILDDFGLKPLSAEQSSDLYPSLLKVLEIFFNSGYKYQHYEISSAQ